MAAEQTRLFSRAVRLSSENANYDGEAAWLQRNSASFTTVNSFPLGPTSTATPIGVSVDSVTFPNVFPNITADMDFTIAIDPKSIAWPATVWEVVVQLKSGASVTITFNTPIINQTIVSFTSITMQASFGVACTNLGLPSNLLDFEQIDLISHVTTLAINPNFARAFKLANGSPWTTQLGFDANQTGFFVEIARGRRTVPEFPTADIFTVTVETDFYSVKGLMDIIVGKLNLIVPGHVFSWVEVDTGSRKVILRSTAPFLIARQGNPGDPTAYQNTLAATLGFIGVPDATALEHVASQVPDMIGAKMVYLESASLTNGGGSLDGRGRFNNSILGIPISVPYGQLQTWILSGGMEGPMARWPGGSNGDTTTIDFKITDQDGNDLFLAPPHQVIVTARVWYEEDFSD